MMAGFQPIEPFARDTFFRSDLLAEELARVFLLFPPKPASTTSKPREVK
jgi:hypothetical protein